MTHGKETDQSQGSDDFPMASEHKEAEGGTVGNSLGTPDPEVGTTVAVRSLVEEARFHTEERS